MESESSNKLEVVITDNFGVAVRNSASSTLDFLYRKFVFGVAPNSPQFSQISTC
jgi:hypothetical protein